MARTVARVSEKAVKNLQAETYLSLLDELLALKTEESFDLGVRHIQWAHMWGKTIRDFHQGEEGMETLLERLASDVGRSKRMLYRYVQLFDRFPDLQIGLNQHGKNVSLRLLLGEQKEAPEPNSDPCKHCPEHCQ